MFFQTLLILQALILFFLSTLVELIRLPLTYSANKARNAIFGDYQADVVEAIEVIENMKAQTNNSRELAQLEHAAQLLKKSSSSKDLSSLPAPKTLQVKDTNRFISAHWFSDSFPDLFWSLTSYTKVEWPVEEKGERAKIKEGILKSKKVQDAMRAAARTNGWSEAQAKSVASKIFEEMVGILHFSSFLISFPSG